MTIEKTFQQLQQRLRELEETLSALETTVDQDRPAGDEVIVASRLSDAVLAAKGYLQDSLIAAGEACTAVESPLDTDGARRALIRCQERFHLLSNYFSGEIASYERWDDLNSVGKRRGREWMGWVSVVQDSLQHCRGLIEDVRRALFLCWQELADRIGAGVVSMRNVQLGQKISFGRFSAGESPGGTAT